MTSVRQLQQLLRHVERRRHVRDTRLNENSSRSHQIVRIYVESRARTDQGETGGEIPFFFFFFLGPQKWREKMGRGFPPLFCNCSKWATFGFLGGLLPPLFACMLLGLIRRPSCSEN